MRKPADLPEATNRYADLSREELERRLWTAEALASALTIRATQAEARLDVLTNAWRVLKELEKGEDA